METIEQHISHFITRQTVASVACSDNDGHLICFNCYYAYDEEQQLLVFKTSDNSLHMQYLRERPQLAGTILPDKLNKLKVRGLQFTGQLLYNGESLAKNVSKLYYRRFPFAMAMEGNVYAIRLDRLKMTDNTLGFGTKLVWDRVQSTVSLV
ncbi:MAG TPA: pyridoxamine 5'-phosphate oxidase family protein [Phnomibacter sp.]|nr:pyridoxamine 5'-phosphate oxidase family protein [Phnomibacter sp.]